MRTIGLIGGMSWESSALYYRIVNETVREQLGGLHSAKVILHSVDFHDIEQMQTAGDWDQAGRYLAQIGRDLEREEADVLVLCTNTMHRVFPAIEAAVEIPVLHIADPTAWAINDVGFDRVGLLGTRFTMEQDFYRERLISRHGIDVIVPEAADRELVHRVIYEELVLGIVSEESRAAYRGVVERLAEAGAQGIILGCTEIGMLISEGDSPVPLFDTTRLHAEAAAEWALLNG